MKVGRSMLETAKYYFKDIIGESKQIKDLKQRAIKASKASSSVLVYGETGVGKELFVHAIHNNSNRKNKPFVVQNCAAVPEYLFESIFFGTTKGSYTGAQNRKGLFEIADGGTLYLDELNSIPYEFQGKLLRVLQEGEIRRIGDNSTRKVDVRIIASMNEVPEKMVENNTFRKDLFYRLNVISIEIPPLRDRREDIVVLIDYFINMYNKKFEKEVTGIESSAQNVLLFHSWPGNIRELKHVIEAIFILKDKGEILVKDLKYCNFEFDDNFIPMKKKLEDIEKQYIIEALLLSNKNVSKAAKLLVIPRQTLQYKIKKYNIS